jgi:hypothetical protein
MKNIDILLAGLVIEEHKNEKQKSRITPHVKLQKMLILS